MIWVYVLIVLTLAVFLLLERHKRSDSDWVIKTLQRKIEDLTKEIEPLRRTNEAFTKGSAAEIREIERIIETFYPSMVQRKPFEDKDWGLRADTIRRALKAGIVDSNRGKKSKEELGTEYELAVAYEYRVRGFSVELNGIRKGLEDMGIDLIAKRGDETALVQCKYWGYDKVIRENVILQLQGSRSLYRATQAQPYEKVYAVLFTNVFLSPEAIRVAEALDIAVYANHSKAVYPKVMCLNLDENGKGKRVFYTPKDKEYATMLTKNNLPVSFVYDEQTALGHGYLPSVMYPKPSSNDSQS